jgi:hypothetical protein
MNPVVERVRGKIGDLVFKKYQDGVVVGRRADQNGSVPTAGQAAQRERFRLAAAYGKRACTDPALKAAYAEAAKARKQPLFAVIVADFFNDPVVDGIDLSAYTGQAGQKITVTAHDDGFEVASVAVVIRDGSNAVLEQGAAVPQTDGSWRYTTTTALAAGKSAVIEATAVDHPGNKAVKSQATAGTSA